jgi:hypothetical protein
MSTQQGERERAVRGMPGGDVVIAHEEPGFVIAEWKNVSIVVWGVQATLPLVARLRGAAEALIARHPEGIASVQIISNGAPLPDSATRAELDRMTDGFAKSLSCVATVLEGSGFWASAMHSFITSIHWVARRPFKVRIGSTLSDAAAWIPTPHYERTRVRVGPTELLRALTSARARVN